MVKAVVLPTSSGFYFEVQSGTPPFTFLYLGKDVIGKTEYPYFTWTVDRSFNFRDAYFKVVDGDGSETYLDVGLKYLTHFEHGMLMEILRREALVLRTRGGFKAKLYKKKKPFAAEPCPECSGDEKYLRGEQSTCPVCFGTGLNGGFYPPFEVYTNYYNRQDARIDALEPIRITNYTLVLLNFPLVEKDDLLFIPALGKMLRITEVGYFEYKGYPVKQIISALEVEAGHPVYKISEYVPLVIQESVGSPEDSLS